MFCILIFYKLFQLLMRIKGDKNIINIPPINLTTKVLWAIRKPLFFKMTKKEFVRASEHLGMTPLIRKWVKNPKKTAIFDHILLKGHDASFEDFTILLKENKFKLHKKESLMIRRDKPELNKNIYSYPLEPFDWLLS